MTGATVIVGACVGGVRTAQALRSSGYQGEITADRTRGRPPVRPAPVVQGAARGHGDGRVGPDARDLGIRLMLGRPARRLDVAGGFVELSDGERLPYDDVVIATGSRARPSPWGKPAGVH